MSGSGAGICAILGSTYTGEFEDVEGLDAAVEKLNAETGWQVPIHVDAASGGQWLLANHLCLLSH